MSVQNLHYHRADSRLVPSQWEMSLQNNTVSHWLGATLESALYHFFHWWYGTWWVPSHYTVVLLIAIGSSPKRPTKFYKIFSAVLNDAVWSNKGYSKPLATKEITVKAFLVVSAVSANGLELLGGKASACTVMTQLRSHRYIGDRHLNSFPPGQNGRHFRIRHFETHFLEWKC